MDILPEDLENIEAQGWEIFSILNTGDTEKYCRAIVRRKASLSELESMPMEDIDE